MTCAFCPFPCPPSDALPTPGGGVAHATCAFEATRTAMLAGLLPDKASVLLKRRISGQPSQNDQPRRTP